MLNNISKNSFFTPALLTALTFAIALPHAAAAESSKKNPKPAAQAKNEQAKSEQAKNADKKNTDNAKTPEKASSDDKSKKDSGGTNSLKQLVQESPTSGGGPLFIKSDTLELNSKEHVFTYKGNVEVVREDVTITAEIVEGQYDDKNQLQTILCRQNVVITKGESMRSTANRAVYHVASATIELTEGPELYREGNALAADKVTMYINEDRSEAEGNVRVKVIKPDEAGK